MVVTVAQDPDKPADPVVLADAIITISRSIKSLSERSRLNKDAIVTLIYDSTRINKSTIINVLDAIADLERKYVTPAKK